MEAAIVLRKLARHRRILAFGAILATLAASTVAYKLPSFESRSFQVGTATAEILVDTPRSQLVETNPVGVDALGPTATLLAAVMTQGSVRLTVAHQAGLGPSNLAAIDVSSAAGSSAAVTQTPPPDSYVRHPGTGILITQTLTNAAGNALPVIQVEARASDPASAVRLVNAAAAALREYVLSTAVAQKIPEKQQLDVSSLGPPQARTQSSGPSPLLAIAVAILLILGMCTAILMASAVSSGWRKAAALERGELDGFDQLDYPSPGVAATGAISATPNEWPQASAVETAPVETPPGFVTSRPEATIVPSQRVFVRARQPSSDIENLEAKRR